MGSPEPRQLFFKELAWIKKDAIDQVEDNANARWFEGAYQIVLGIAQKNRLFTTDLAWEALAHTDLVTHETRGMGAVMRRIDREGKARPTKDYVPSVRAVRHGGPVRVWHSYLWWPSGSVA